MGVFQTCYLDFSVRLLVVEINNAHNIHFFENVENVIIVQKAHSPLKTE